MTEKPKCSQCHEREVFSKGLCSGCYGKNWRLARKAERAAAVVEDVPPKQLTSGVTDADLAVIEGEIVHDEPPNPPETHLVATDPVQMKAAQGDLRAWLEQKLTILERDIIEANRALNVARQNGWATGSFTAARNRAVDDETFYSKILAAVEAGYTMIPDFPIQVFTVRVDQGPKEEANTFRGVVNARDTYLGHPVPPDCAPVGTGDYRNPTPATWVTTRENTKVTPENQEPRYFTTIKRYTHPAAPIAFPVVTGRSPIMQATAKAMKDKAFDQIGVCHPNIPVAATRRVNTRSARTGDPLVIGQILHKRVGSEQKCVSFIIAWHLNLNDL